MFDEPHVVKALGWEMVAAPLALVFVIALDLPKDRYFALGRHASHRPVLARTMAGLESQGFGRWPCYAYIVIMDASKAERSVCSQHGGLGAGATPR